MVDKEIVMQLQRQTGNLSTTRLKEDKFQRKMLKRQLLKCWKLVVKKSAIISCRKFPLGLRGLKGESECL